jgi:Zn-dependent protease/CBS domain-containing protein
MRGKFRIGTVFGIKLLVDPSWIFIFLLVTFQLVTQLWQLHPGWSSALSLLLAIGTALLFFGSVLVHELAHAVVALRQGIPVLNITLFLFGGVANIQREPPSPRAEFLITIVGPIASFLLGVLFLALSYIIGGIGSLGATVEVVLARLGPLGTMFVWLGSVNILLAVFNLLPGFPLDGGRVLRSALWAATGNLRKATLWAGRVGQALAWLFIVGGVATVFGARIALIASRPLSGLWLIFIGWFLNNAATQSYRQLLARDLLVGVPVSRVMRADVPAVVPHHSVNQLVHEHIMGTDQHAFPVLRDDQLVGLVCLHDVRRVPRSEWDTTSVQAIMTPADQLIVTSPEEDLADAIERLVRREVGQLPVLHAGHFVGLLRQRDVARWLTMQGGM